MPQLPIRPGEPCPHPECGIEVESISSLSRTFDVTTLGDTYGKLLWSVTYTAHPCEHAWVVDSRPKTLAQTFPRAEQKHLRCLWPHDAHWGTNVTATDEEKVHMMCFICRVEWMINVSTRYFFDDYDVGYADEYDD